MGPRSLVRRVVMASLMVTMSRDVMALPMPMMPGPNDPSAYTHEPTPSSDNIPVIVGVIAGALVLTGAAIWARSLMKNGRHGADPKDGKRPKNGAVQWPVEDTDTVSQL